jgi:Trk-type K+ transport system membrane component
VGTTTIVSVVLHTISTSGEGRRLPITTSRSDFTIVVVYHCIIVSTITTSCICWGTTVVYLVEVFRHPILATEFILRLSRQVVRDLSSETDTGHGVEYDSICYVIADPHNSSVEAGLDPVDLLSIPQSHSHHRSTYVD